MLLLDVALQAGLVAEVGLAALGAREEGGPNAPGARPGRGRGRRPAGAGRPRPLGPLAVLLDASPFDHLIVAVVASLAVVVLIAAVVVSAANAAAGVAAAAAIIPSTTCRCHLVVAAERQPAFGIRRRGQSLTRLVVGVAHVSGRDNDGVDEIVLVRLGRHHGPVAVVVGVGVADVMAGRVRVYLASGDADVLLHLGAHVFGTGGAPPGLQGEGLGLVVAGEALQAEAPLERLVGQAAVLVLEEVEAAGRVGRHHGVEVHRVHAAGGAVGHQRGLHAGELMVVELRLRRHPLLEAGAGRTEGRKGCHGALVAVGVRMMVDVMRVVVVVVVVVGRRRGHAGHAGLEVEVALGPRAEDAAGRGRRRLVA